MKAETCSRLIVQIHVLIKYILYRSCVDLNEHYIIKNTFPDHNLTVRVPTAWTMLYGKRYEQNWFHDICCTPTHTPDHEDNAAGVNLTTNVIQYGQEE
jgi:hypothetical protein